MTHFDDAQIRARALNRIMDEEASLHVLDDPRTLMSRLRAFLISNEQEEAANNPVQLLKSTQNGDVVEIVLGPQIDKGPTAFHFRFDSGARLSFGITIRRAKRKSKLIAYRFHYVYNEGHSPSFIRFDLNASDERPALQESRCHLHPGSDEIRLPSRVFGPLEMLDRIFFVLDKCQCPIHVFAALNAT